MNNEILKNRVWKTANLVGILLVVLLIVISIKEFKSIAYVGKDIAVMNAITVNGKGEAVTIPDVATFSFSVIETAQIVDEAQAKATAKINLIIKAIKDGGVDEPDIKTLSYTINPHYKYMNQSSILDGYDVSQTIEVKVRDIKKAGMLFTAVGSLGVQNINNLIFSVDDIDTIKIKARNLAIEDAQKKAKELAKKLGVRLVQITSFYDASDEKILPYPYVMDDEIALMKVSVQSTPKVPIGEQKIVSMVTITYEIR